MFVLKLGRPPLIQKCFRALASSSAKSTRPTSKFGQLATKNSEIHQRLLPANKLHNLDGLHDADGEEEHYAKISDVTRPFPRDFELKIEDLLEKRQLKEALKVLDEEMRDECVKPNKETYAMLIHACGQVGYAQKAIDLLFRYRSGGNKVALSMYADAFHGCAMAPKETKATCLKMARNLKFSLDKTYQAGLSPPLYHTMISAFGRCGDLETAFTILDEMAAKGVRIGTETYNHLLQACIGDKESGFKLALTLYRRLLEQKCTPSVHTFNLLLRATLECSIGPEHVVNDVLLEAMSSRQVRQFKEKLLPENKKMLSPGSQGHGQDAEENQTSQSKLVLVTEKCSQLQTQLPNLLSRKPVMDLVTGLSPQFLQTPQGRFQLLGDLEGFVRVVTQEFKADLDITTFSLLIGCIDSSLEINLVELLREHNVKPDVDFFNQLMRRRAGRGDYEQARQVLDLISDFDLSPDIVTFGCLAMGCKDQRQILTFMDDMKNLKIMPNMQIMTALASNTLYPNVMIKLLKFVERNDLQIDERFILKVDRFYRSNQSYILKAEKEGQSISPKKQQRWEEFCQFYKEWQKRAIVNVTPHPWKQFKTKRDRRS